MAFTSKLGSAQLGGFQLATIGDTNLYNPTSVISFSQSATVIVAGNDYASNALNFNQTVNVSSPNKRISASSSITFVSSVIRKNIINKSATDTLTFYLVADEEKKTLVQNTITLTDLVTVSQSVGAYSSLAFTQTLINQYNPHFGIINQTPVFVQTIHIGFVPKLSTDTITFIGNAVGKIVKNKSLISLLPINHDATSGKREQARNSISFSNTASTLSNETQSVSDTLVFTDSNTVSETLNFLLTDTITFSNDNHTLNGLQVPNLQITIPKPNVMLQSTDLAIILPRPVYNDSEAETDELVKMRAINGTLYTYVKTNVNRVLKYDIEMDRKKQYELRHFMDNYITDRLQLTNWKGEIWSGYITNNPFEFVTILRKNNCGERYKVTLEFNGTMIHG